MRDLVFLDIETTGLVPERHEVWEVAFAVNDAPVETCIVPHTLKTADPKALELNGYYKRIHYTDQGVNYDMQIRRILEGNTVVAANPSFDVDFLYRRWGVAPWHHRKIDVESMAYAILEYDEMKGLAGIRDDLWGLGFNLEQPDHSASKDVEVLRQCYKALRSIQSQKQKPDSLSTTISR